MACHLNIHWSAMTDKIPWNTCVIAWIFCISKTEFEKALLSFSKFVSVPPPPPHTMLKLQHCRWGGGGAKQVKLSLILEGCEKAPQVQICPKTFVPDCSSWIARKLCIIFNYVALSVKFVLSQSIYWKKIGFSPLFDFP